MKYNEIKTIFRVSMNSKPIRDRVTFDGKLHNDNKLMRHASYQDKKSRTNHFASHTHIRANATRIKVDEVESLGQQSNQQIINEEKVFENSIYF